MMSMYVQTYAYKAYEGFKEFKNTKKMATLTQLLEKFDATFSSYSMLVVTSTTILAFLCIMLFKWKNNKRNLPPSPPGLPVLGNLHQLGLLAHRTLWSMAKSHGNLMLLYFGKVPVLVASSPDSASLIMKTHDIAFANRPKTTIFKRLLYEFKDVASAPHGEYWRQLKSILVLHLLSNKRVKSFDALRREETSFMLDKIKHAADSCSPVNLTEAFATLSNDIACRITLGERYDGQQGGKELRKAVREFADLLGTFDVGSYLGWLKWLNRINGLNARIDKVVKEIDRIIDGTVEERIAESEENSHNQDKERRDFLDSLLWIQKKNMLGFPLDRDGVKALLLDMLVAGTDTTSTAMDWTMTQLLRHPEKMKKLQKEVRQIAEGKPLITEEKLDSLEYLKAVIKEALRLHPPVPLLVMRETSQDVNVQGYDIAAGTMAIVNAWAIGRDPALWEQAEEFLPERFLNSSIDVKGQDFQLIPFGAGRRGCPGIQFALTVIELVLANLVYKFDWSVCENDGGKSIDIAEVPGITVHRKYPLIVVPTLHSC